MVKRSELPQVFLKLKQATTLALDTETQGLRVWQNDKLFSVIISDGHDSYYFNFQNYPNLDPECLLLKEDVDVIFWFLFKDPNRIWYLQNAKFDLAALWMFGFEILGKIHCTLTMARIQYNEHLNYSLDECAKRIGLQKDSAVDDYILEKKLWEWEVIPGKKIRGKKKFFDRIPPETIVPYGKRDAAITYALGCVLNKDIENTSKTTDERLPNILSVLENEFYLTKTCFEMERIGIKIDKEYCEEAVKREKEKCRRASEAFTSICNLPFIDSNKALSKAFKTLGIEGLKTEKGNPSFTDEALKAINHPLAEVIREHREAYKKATTYYQSFLYFSDKNSCIHANIKQAGTTTGRFSYSDPNLQNIPKESEVRRAFIPRDEFCFVEFDYKAMEYRLMAEYANEELLIEKINAGLDVHEATAQMMKVDRQTAKTLNFMLLYGGGAQKLANALNLTLDEAKELKQKYFSALPRVKKFIYEVTNAAERRGFIFNWLGRRCYFPNKDFCYKAPNALIQGGCSDIVKYAMNCIERFLHGNPNQTYLSRMVLQVHDSVLFEIHETEFSILPEIKNFLESAYPAKYLKMETSVSHSHRSWGNLVDGYPVAGTYLQYVTQSRDEVQKLYPPKA